jgi:hypothetical protein
LRAISPRSIASLMTEVGRAGLEPATYGLTPHGSRWLPTDHVFVCPPTDYVAHSARVEPPAIRSKVDELRPAGHVTVFGHIPFTPRAKQTLERSVHEAQLRGHEVVDAEHLLWALTREPDATAVNVLNSCGVPCESIRQRIELKWRA